LQSAKAFEQIQKDDRGESTPPSTPPYDGLPDVAHAFHDRDILVTACGRIYRHRKKINISTVMAGQSLGTEEVDDGS
jgi:hypothetical protein